jgi:3-phenylpropionate/trans-cinnamate dioxygenase ferredoxin reductase subunit
MIHRIVIVGAGQAAAQAVTSLRGLGYQDEIRIFGDEPVLPYQRPPLSKALLSGATTLERLELKPASFYADQGIDLHLGSRVGAIDPTARAITTVTGETFAYDRLLIATGTRAAKLAVPGASLAGVLTLRSAADALRLKPVLKPGARLVVVGSGYVGLEVAAQARKLGLEVVLIARGERVLSHSAAPTIAHALMARHEAEGVRILTKSGIASISGQTHVDHVHLTDGRALPADLVLVAVGAETNAELATAAGLAVDGGIVVDAATRTSAPGIFAAGDVTLFPSVRYQRRIRLESVQNAIDQSKAAAAAMLGEKVFYDPLPWFWSDQYDIKFQMAGLGTGADRFETDPASGDGKLCVRAYHKDRLIAVETLNDPRSHMLARRALTEPVTSDLEAPVA